MIVDINDPDSFTFVNVGLLLASVEDDQPYQLRVRRDGTVFLSPEPDTGSANIDDIALRLESFYAKGYVGQSVLRDPNWVASVYLTLKKHWPVLNGASLFVDVFEPGGNLLPSNAPLFEIAPASDPPDIEGFDDDEAVAAMERWFLDNFDDLEGFAPDDPADPNYQSLLGPYDPEDELARAFADASPQLIEEALDRISEDGIQTWGVHIDRVRPFFSGFVIEDGDLGALKQFANRALSLMHAVGNESPGIGHNGPPDDVPLSYSELTELEIQLNEVQSYLPTTPNLEPLIRRTLVNVARYVHAIGRWLFKKMDLFCDEAFKKAGAFAGLAAVGVAAGVDWGKLFGALADFVGVGSKMLGGP